MSKKYNNSITLFGNSDTRKKQVFAIKTNGTAANDPKKTEGAPVFEIYKALANEKSTKKLQESLESGEMGWAQAKQELLFLLGSLIGPYCKKYEHFINHPEEVNELLLQGASRARPIAKATMRDVHSAIGRLELEREIRNKTL